MTILEELQMAQDSLRETVRLLRNAAIAHPEAEATLRALSMSENTDPGVRAMLKVLLAMGTFALGQEQAERTIVAAADAQKHVTNAWVN